MLKLKKLLIILMTIANYSSYGAGGPTSIPTAIAPAPQIKKSFICPICSKSFLHKGHLNDHMRTHTGERPYICAKCNKPFSDKSHLTRHMRTHTDERPHHCLKCGKNFGRKGNLTAHMLTHIDVRPHSCSECGKAFTKKGDLNRHTLTHTGERPYACSECGRSFSQKGSLTQHLQTCKSMRLKQRVETDSEEEFGDPDILEKYLKKRVKIDALLTIGPDVFNETEAAAPAAKAAPAKAYLE